MLRNQAAARIRIHAISDVDAHPRPTDAKADGGAFAQNCLSDGAFGFDVFQHGPFDAVTFHFQ